MDHTGSKITYKEFFEKLETDISEVDKRLIDIQALSSPKTSPVTDPTVEYLKTSQVYLRALLQKYHKQLAWSSAVDWATKCRDDLAASSYDGFDFAWDRNKKAIKDLDAATTEFKASIPELVESVEKLKQSRKQVQNLFPEDALIPLSQMDAVMQKNASRP